MTAKDVKEQFNRISGLGFSLWGRAKGPEASILLVGIVMVLAYLFAISVTVLLEPRSAQAIIGITATNVLFGRAAGMSLSYAFGFGHALVLPLNMYIETTLVLLFYPLFVFSLKHLLVWEWAQRAMRKTLEAAERHHQKVRRYGIAGLFLFVWFPFTMTGPMVGSIIGHMIGLNPWMNMTVVLVSTYLAIVSWALFLGGMLERAAAFSPYAPIIVVGSFIAALALAALLRSIRARR